MGVPAPLPNQDRTGHQYSGGIQGIVIATVAVVGMSRSVWLCRRDGSLHGGNIKDVRLREGSPSNLRMRIVFSLGEDPGSSWAGLFTSVTRPVPAIAAVASRRGFSRKGNTRVGRTDDDTDRI